MYSLAEFKHDENGYIISNTRYDGDGNLDSTTKYENDRNGNVILESEYDADGNLTFEIKYEYNSHNDITKMEVNYKSGSYTNTNTVIYEYDGKELSKTTTYDESDNVLYYTVYTYPDKTTCEQTTYYDTFESYNVSTYDKSGNLTKVVYYDEDGNEEFELLFVALNLMPLVL